MKALVSATAILALAWAATVAAGEERQRPSSASGAFVSAELAGEVINWQLDLGQEAGKKTYEMTVDVKVAYSEKDGVKQGQSIRRAAGRDLPPRPDTVVVKGKFVSAKLQDDKVLVTITPAEGDKPLEVVLPKQLSVWYREEGGKLTAYSVGIPRPPRQPKEK
jgi:hypothetical protein